MEIINGVFFIKQPASSEQAQSFLDQQERLFKRPIILERVNEEKGRHYVTGRILDDILANLEYWSEFDQFEDALNETQSRVTI